MNKIILDRRYWLVPLAIWTVVVLGSLGWSFFVIERQVEEIAASQGREIFHLMDALRLWNVRHDGVYVLQTAAAPPNPYLEAAKREIVAADGRRLTFVNPAYMTRQVADTFRELTGIRVHLTSLTPVNPDNAADAWERGALEAFARGEGEHAEVLRQNGAAIARYMAPLVVREVCVDCHASQHYKVNDVRGGISISFPTAPIRASLQGQLRNAVLVHLVGWLLVAALAVYALARSRAHLLALDRGRGELEALVGQRTADLRREVGERQQAETRLRLLIDASGNGVFGLAANGECTFINPVALQLLGALRAEAFLGRPIIDLIVPVDAQAARLREALRQGRSLYTDDCAFERADGSTFPAEIRLDPIAGDGSAGAVVNFAGITKRKAAEANIWHQANYDALTGLPNRSLFHDRLEQAFAQARRGREIFALLFVDLDGFKAVNDHCGHEAGDCVLQQTAQRLLDGVRESDIAARLAGDEFLVILRNLGSEERAGVVAAKLVETLAEPCRCGEREVRVSASIGIALYPEDADNPADLVKCADQAMYKAKEGGRHTYRYYAGGHYDRRWWPAT